TPAGHARRGRHALQAVAGAAVARPVPASERRRSHHDRNPGRHRAERPAENRADHQFAAAACRQVEGVLQAAGQERQVPSARRRGRTVGGHRRRRDRPRHAAYGGEVRVTTDPLWPTYATPADLDTIESIPLADRGLPSTTYDLLTRA